MKRRTFITKTIVFTILVAIGLIFNTRALYAQSQPGTSDKPTLFILDSCPYSKSLLDETASLGVEASYLFNTIEIDTTANETLFRQAIEACGSKVSAVPLLFDGEECYVGGLGIRTYLNASQYFQDAGVFYATNAAEGSEDRTEVTLSSATDESSQDGEDQLAEQQPESQFSAIKFGIGLIAPVAMVIAAIIVVRKYKL